MRVGVWIVVLASISASCRERPGQVEVNVISAESTAIVIGVTNGTEREVVLLSPHMPGRSVDAERCTVELSTKVDAHILLFAFTPRLVTLGAGESRQFRAALDPLHLSNACAQWNVSAEYAYIRPDEVEMFKGKPSEDFRQYVLQHQQVVTTSAAVTLSEK